ncbi:MAG TPA: GAF domain-containing protein [Bacillaceae bacterium]|uniref:GAF domain-containing protein n=2 Tax=Lederbergia graminis TaxID=735518 RepID=A0ABW0LG50_9BACI|nr:GAF domain-containing protein [Bacillaceae bacterium]
MMDNNIDYQTLIDELRAQSAIDLIALAFVQTSQLDYVLKWQYASGNINNRYKRVVLQSGKGIAGLVYKSGKPMYIKDITDNIITDLYNYPIVVSEDLKRLVAFPIFEGQQDKVKGVILLGNRDTKTSELKDYQHVYTLFLKQISASGFNGVSW